MTTHSYENQMRVEVEKEEGLSFYLLYVKWKVAYFPDNDFPISHLGILMIDLVI